MDATAERKARRQANHDLASLTTYNTGIPVTAIDGILTQHGFNATQQGIYCGREGKLHEQVGTRTWLTMTWYRMDVSGLYEVTAYLS